MGSLLEAYMAYPITVDFGSKDKTVKHVVVLSRNARKAILDELVELAKSIEDYSDRVVFVEEGHPLYDMLKRRINESP